ncbi:hypothetical protein [Pseudomonas oryzihabitans]|uniref:hypothetical protein n=1 Tax=Pseudomonas oryzihabitans TaxID=47885 RepID=UPI002B1E46EE|nr:hypothetical protein [Pseudomonas oryzihabitans]
MLQSSSNSQAIQPKRLAKFIARMMTAISVLLGAMWAIITYAFPDPSVFGFSFINWKNLVLFISSFLFLGALSIGWQIRNARPGLKGFLNVFLTAGLCFSFFMLGSEYAKPSFEFAKIQAKVIENDGSNLLGKRMETLDSMRFELSSCESIGKVPNCSFKITPLNADRTFRFSNETSIFDESGAELAISSVRAGQVEKSPWNEFQLIKSVPTQITITFKEARGKMTRTPAVRLKFRGDDREDHILKFTDITMD